MGQEIHHILLKIQSNNMNSRTPIYVLTYKKVYKHETISSWCKWWENYQEIDLQAKLLPNKTRIQYHYHQQDWKKHAHA